MDQVAVNVDQGGLVGLLENGVGAPDFFVESARWHCPPKPAQPARSAPAWLERLLYLRPLELASAAEGPVN